MSIDDPLEATLKQIAADERQRSPVTDIMMRFTKELVPGGGLIGDFLQRHRDENVSLLYEALTKNLQNVNRRFEDLDDRHREFLRNEYLALAIDGFKKAENLHSQKRILRIAQILANAAEAGPSASADDTEELMRVAVEISDLEVEFLKLMNRNRRFEKGGPGMATIDDANSEWLEIKPEMKHLGVHWSDGQSMARKLESFGLIENVERRNTKLDPNMTPYRMLAKGAKFIRFALSEAEKMGAAESAERVDPAIEERRV